MAVEVNTNYKAGLIESIKVAGQMIIDMAEDIAGNSDYISGLSISADFDPKMRSIPEITIKRSHLPSIEIMEHLLDVYSGKEKDYEGAHSGSD